MKIITLSKKLYEYMAVIKKKFGLDFDDAYQYKVAKEHDLKLVTFGKDFEKVNNDVTVTFLQTVV